MPPDSLSTEEKLSIEEWKRRFAKRIMDCASWNEVAAIQHAEEAAKELKDTGMWDGFEDAPEDAADEEMSNWDDDGNE